MRDKVRRWCRENAMLSPGQTVVCAVSGGADSVAMLHILCSLREALGVTVSAAHFNHRLRGAESDRDEAFVRKLCDDWGVPLAAASGDAAARARETGESLEEAARNLRYTFFASLGQAVATAHTADDNLETMLLNFLRGTGLTGLGGIPPKRDFLVRPILCCTRQEVLAYLDAHRLPHVEDSTNAADDCVRNRLRHNVLPLLKAENPALAETALRTAQDVYKRQRRYRVYGNYVRSEDDATTVMLATIFFADMTEMFNIRDEFMRTRPIISVILVDNYDELTNNLSDSAVSQIDAKINDAISAWTEGLHAICRKIERNRYLLVFESKDLQKLQDGKFSLLDSIRSVQNLSLIHI